MKATFEALVVPGAGLTPTEELTVKATQRMDTAIAAWQSGVAGDMVVSGGHSFRVDTPSVPEAFVMGQYGVDQGVPEEAMHKEGNSLETIGNGLFTKTDIVVPNDWEHLMVVTSRSHLPRTLKIFRHTMGPDIEVQGMPAPEHVTLKDRAYEMLGVAMMHEVLRGTKPGDDEAIRERLFDLVPGYAGATTGHLALQSFLGIFRGR